MQPPIKIEPGGHMPCPLCDEPYTHIDDVIMAGRPQEDGPFEPVQVDHRGNIKEHYIDYSFLKRTRRHSIGLIGWCESCEGRFAIEFCQHKGATVVRLYRLKWQEICDGKDYVPEDIEMVNLETQFYNKSYEEECDDLF